MNQLEKTVSAYQDGLLSRVETICKLGAYSSEIEPDEMMKLVPKELHPFLKKYIETYKPGEMLSIGGAEEVPLESLQKLRNWFSEKYQDPGALQ